MQHGFIKEAELKHNCFQREFIKRAYKNLLRAFIKMLAKNTIKLSGNKNTYNKFPNKIYKFQNYELICGKQIKIFRI